MDGRTDAEAEERSDVKSYEYEIYRYDEISLWLFYKDINFKYPGPDFIRSLVSYNHSHSMDKNNGILYIKHSVVECV